ncbi:nitroreductase [Paenibacillus psychroresistens]|uniref:Putative NAD(P)H nitroreductase n=1 Tax=Paenibacillus psychroresistens TaxID=1778678 RepID=A0A6B8RQU6_9BACL|nr:nitroreductase [Paenibacillus psychroresistens]QGQ98217.1 nitroreductase [Paenibacillus psychroresistens]
MNLEEAIRGRRSIGMVKPDEVDQALIEKLLEAAVYAPNHHMTEPWRFYVLQGNGRAILGHAYADIAGEFLDEPFSEVNIEALKKHYNKAFRAPVIIVAVSEATDSPKVDRREEIAAVHAAVQNLLLQAHALGLGAVWRTGAPAYHPFMKNAFKLKDEHDIVGFIYVGHPVQLPTVRTPASFASKTVWLNEED